MGSPGADITGADSGAVYLYRFGAPTGRSRCARRSRAWPAAVPSARAWPWRTRTGMGTWIWSSARPRETWRPRPRCQPPRHGGHLHPHAGPARAGPAGHPAGRLGPVARRQRSCPAATRTWAAPSWRRTSTGTGCTDVAALSKRVALPGGRHHAGHGAAWRCPCTSARADGPRFRAIAGRVRAAVQPGGRHRGHLAPGRRPGRERPACRCCMAVADRADSPDLRTSGRQRGGHGRGRGAAVRPERATSPRASPSDTPVQVTRDAAFARIYGEARGIFAGRSFAVMDVDGQPGSELVLGRALRVARRRATPRCAWRAGCWPIRWRRSPRAACINKPLAVVHGQNQVGRARRGPGRVDAAERAGAGGLLRARLVRGRAPSPDGWSSSRGRAPRSRSGRRGVSMVPAKPAVERFGEVVAAATGVGGRTVALVGAPGFAGPGTLVDGNDFNVGRAFTYDVTQGTAAAMVAEGASAPVVKGRNVGTDVTFTDFNGDGRHGRGGGRAGLHGAGPPRRRRTWPVRTPRRRRAVSRRPRRAWAGCWCRWGRRTAPSRMPTGCGRRW